MKDIVLESTFILHRSMWREKSLLLDVFSRDQGRFRIIARGQRTAKKKSANFEPFQSYRILARGQSELKTLTGIESLEGPRELSGRQLYCGLYLNELLVRLLPLEDEAADLFAVYQNCLDDLANLVGAEETVLRQFERALFAYCGLGVESSYCADGFEIDSNKQYRWIDTKGWVSVVEGGKDVFPGSFILKLADDEIDAEFLPTYKRLHRQLVNDLLGGRELHSRKLFA